jgi:hypothetical protein
MGTKTGFAFDGRGRLDRIDTYTTKAGKDIITLVLQVEGSYPQLVPIKFFGRMADEAKARTVGDVLDVTGRLGGRDWNGKVYGDIVGESIEVVAEAQKQQDLPASGVGQGATPASFADPSDSVPF